MVKLDILYNPFDHKLDLARKVAQEAEQASRVVLTFDCLVSTVAGDIVYEDPVTANRVLTNVDNAQSQLSLGIVINKPTTTTCEVLVLGIESGFSGMSIGDKVFLSTSGGLTNTAPLTDYVQTMGIAVSPTTIFFMPNSTRVVRA